MSEVFRRATHLKDHKLATSLYKHMASSKGTPQENYFRCLREATNLLSKHPQARTAVDYCFQDEDMDSTMMNRVVLYHMNTLLDAFAPSPYSSELAMTYARACRGQNPIELDRSLSENLLPRAKTWLQQLQSKNH